MEIFVSGEYPKTFFGEPVISETFLTHNGIKFETISKEVPDILLPGFERPKTR